MKQRRISFLFWILIWFLPIICHAQETPVDNPVSVYSPDYWEKWIEDRQFVYGSELLGFDLEDYLTTYAPHLIPYKDEISHWSGYYSISPKVLLTVMDMQSELVSNSNTEGLLDSPFVGLVASIGFGSQVKELLSALYSDYYAFILANKESDDTYANDEINAATYALLNLFRKDSALEDFIFLQEALRLDFLARYEQLFPGYSDNTEAHEEAVEIEAIPPVGFLQLPWEIGQSWYFNGVHTTTGNDPGVMSSIDFVEDWSLD